jgi:hypothetical protein
MSDAFMSSQFSSSFRARSSGDSSTALPRQPQDADATGAPGSVRYTDDTPMAMQQADGCP